MQTFTGAMTALATPLRNGKLDEEALRRHIEEQIAAGIDVLVPCGTTGESSTLGYEEHIKTVTATVQAAGKRVPVVAGAGSNSTREAIELSKAAREAGVDGLLQITPYYNKPTQDGLVAHFKAILEEAPLPTILYNVPGRTGCDMKPETVERLCDIPEFVGVKEATASMLRAQEIIARCGDRIAVISGDDFTILPLLAVGGRGVISVVSNIVPGDVAALCDAASEGNWDRAREMQYKILPLASAMFIESNPIPVKGALALLGKFSEEIRPPLYAISGGAKQQLQSALQKYGLLP